MLAGRKSLPELTRSSRHIAIRHSKVLDCKERLGFGGTKEQRADGMTKASNVHALKILFEPNCREVYGDDYSDEEINCHSDFVECYYLSLYRRR